MFLTTLFTTHEHRFKIIIFFTTNLIERNHAPLVIKYLTTKHNFHNKKQVILKILSEYTLTFLINLMVLDTNIINSKAVFCLNNKFLFYKIYENAANFFKESAENKFKFIMYCTCF